MALFVGACAADVGQEPSTESEAAGDSAGTSAETVEAQTAQVSASTFETGASEATRQALGISKWTAQRIGPSIHVTAHTSDDRIIHAFDIDGDDPRAPQAQETAVSAQQRAIHDAYLADARASLEASAPEEELISKGGDPTCGNCGDGMTKTKCYGLVLWCYYRNLCGGECDSELCGGCIGFSF